MRGLKRNPWLFGLGVLLAIPVGFGGHARADVNTDQSGSIVIFPKVIADGTRDTLIKLTNRSNMAAQAHCFYVNALGFCSATTTDSCVRDEDCPSTETCNVNWTVTNFDIFLTAQQPTWWRASTGRFNPVPQSQPPCRVGQTCACTIDLSSGALSCPGYSPGTGGFNSEAVAGVGDRFVGELKCVQVSDDFETPVAANSLLGTAVIEDLTSGQVSEYNALTINAFSSLSGPGLNGDNDLLLNNVEYNACPATLILNHYADNSIDTAVPPAPAEPRQGAGFTDATITTELTLIPCTELFEFTEPTRARALFTIYNEFEVGLSASITFDCYLNARLGAISSQFTIGSLGSQFAQTRITPPDTTVCMTGSRKGLSCTTDNEDLTTGCPGRFIAPDSGQSLGCRPWPGLLGVSEEFYSLSGRPDGTAAANLHVEGTRTGLGDIIVVPQGP